MSAVQVSITDARKHVRALSVCLIATAKLDCWNTGMTKTCGRGGDHFYSSEITLERVESLLYSKAPHS